MLVIMINSAISKYSAAITGTSASATRDTRLMPPKIIGAAKITKAVPTMYLFQPQAFSVAATIELACTALNTKPKAKIRLKANKMPSQRCFRPLVM